MRTLVLYVVLMFVFVGLFKFFQANAPAEPLPEKDDATLWRDIAIQFLPILVFFTIFVVSLRRLRTTNRVAGAGVALLGQGRYAEALEQFEQYRRANPRDAVGAFNTGAAKLSLWKVEAARADLQAAEQMGGGTQGALATALPEHLALALALLGDEPGARRMLSSLPVGKGDVGRVALAEAILLARAGNASEARRRLSSFESKQLSGSIGALSRTLDAMCVESLTGELRHVDRVALFGETGPDELRKAWPELIAFVERAPAS
jgi:hypothetical protein